MNIKLVKLRIKNKKLKSDLKGYKRMISIEATHFKLITSLENDIENMKNENEHKRKLNSEYALMYVDLCRETSLIEKDLAVYKKRLIESESITAGYKSLIEGYKENINRLSKEVVMLTNKNEVPKSTGVANRLKNILGIR